MKSVKSYKGEYFESNCFRTEQYIEFEKQCKKELLAQLKKFGIKLHKFLPNHFEWSAVLEKGGKYVYVRLSDVRFWDWYNDILIRTMAHDSDWTGGTNNTCTFAQIGEFADKLFNL